MKKIFYYTLLCLGYILSSCNSNRDNNVLIKKEESNAIDSIEGKSTFKLLLQIVPLDNLVSSDSLSFLLLPLEDACPSCRTEVIDSIYKYRQQVTANNFIILSARSGKKNMIYFFKEQGYRLPDLGNQLVLDSAGKAYDLGLYEEQPVFIYSTNKMVYKKIETKPFRIKKDLREYFNAL
jgi:hypothetical protein